MDPLNRDDIVHAIGQTMKFYGKEIDQLAARFWLNALRDHDPEVIKRALVDYTAQGKYAPKPVDIVELIEVRRAQHRGRLPPPKPDYKPASEETSNAWRWFIWHHSGLEPAGQPPRNLPPETIEKYLRIVNEQAKAQNMPEAIPDDYKLREVWR